jgi:predicted amidohydrolase
MKRKTVGCITLLGLLAFAVAPSSAAPADQNEGTRNLVKNPGFESIDEHQKSAVGWRREAPREEIAPIFELDGTVAHSGKYSAKLSSKGLPGTFGFWATTVQGIQGGNRSNVKEAPTAVTVSHRDFLGDRAYRVRCYFRGKDLESIDKNVWILVHWKDEKGQSLFAQYLSSYVPEGEWYKAEQVLTGPLQARSLDLELVLQWTDKGTVWWDDISVEEALPSPPRKKIKVATVSGKPPAPSTPEKNRQFYAEKVAAAGRAGADIICLGEGISMVSTDKKFAEVAETVPGPTSQALGEVARKHHLYVVVGIYEREGPLLYNTALLIDRSGKVAGKYRKTHLPETEARGGLMSGTTYPVFKTDFGTIGLQICYDNFFPEVTRNLVLNGAEMIFLPIWGDLRGEGYHWDIVARARAIDNAVYFIASIYDTKRSLIIDPNGRILADTKGSRGMVTAEIDLGMRTFERWLSVGTYGEWRNLYPKERRSETYGPLMVIGRDLESSVIH